MILLCLFLSLSLALLLCGGATNRWRRNDKKSGCKLAVRLERLDFRGVVLLCAGFSLDYLIFIVLPIVSVCGTRGVVINEGRFYLYGLQVVGAYKSSPALRTNEVPCYPFPEKKRKKNYVQTFRRNSNKELLLHKSSHLH